MYSLEINLLRDRPEYNKPDQVEVPKESGSSKPSQPLIIGAAVGALFIGAVLAYWYLMNSEISSLQTEIQQQEAQIKEAQALQGKITQIKQQTDAIKQQTQGISGLFTKMMPWSALLQEIREKTPIKVQIKGIEQIEKVEPRGATPTTPADPKAPPPAPPAPTYMLEIQGTAASYTDLNNFILLLERSDFLAPGKTTLVNARLIDNPTPVQLPEQAGEIVVKLPQVIDYKISTTLNNEISATDPKILRLLERRGAIGLVNRIKALEKVGDR